MRLKLRQLQYFSPVVDHVLENDREWPQSTSQFLDFIGNFAAATGQKSTVEAMTFVDLMIGFRRLRFFGQNETVLGEVASALTRLGPSNAAAVPRLDSVKRFHMLLANPAPETDPFNLQVRSFCLVMRLGFGHYIDTSQLAANGTVNSAIQSNAKGQGDADADDQKLHSFKRSASSHTADLYAEDWARLNCHVLRGESTAFMRACDSFRLLGAARQWQKQIFGYSGGVWLDEVGREVASGQFPWQTESGKGCAKLVHDKNVCRNGCHLCMRCGGNHPLHWPQCPGRWSGLGHHWSQQERMQVIRVRDRLIVAKGRRLPSAIWPIHAVQMCE